MHTSVITLWDWLAITDNPEPCDLIFLFGGAVLDIAEKGADLYSQGLAPLVVTTGNTGTFGNPEWNHPIAEVFADYLVKHGVPKTALLAQNTSMNTLEDVTHALPLLAERNVQHNSVILVSRPVHQRRAYATYKMQDPNAKIYNVPCHEPHPSTLQGEALMEVAKRCIQEYDRLIKYAAQGDICEQPIPQAVQAAYNEVRLRVSV